MSLEGIEGSKGVQPSSSPTGGTEGPEGFTGDGPIQTLDDLHAWLIKTLGKEEGEKWWNMFVTNMQMSVMSQLQQSQARLKKAMSEMRH